MNILYLSHLSGSLYAGPTYSVPKQIAAQSKIDNVFWYNAVQKSPEAWKELKYYHDLSDYPAESIHELPEPFNNPDLIVVECFYNMTNSRLLIEMVRGKTPYVIIPRGELTDQAQKRKKLKKMIANMLICKKYAQKAAAIQYLTEQEYKDSGTTWNKNALIIPNGIDIPKKTKTGFTKSGIKCVSIGRLEPYQKGLDLLIEACDQIRSELMEANCTIDLYGPDVDGKKKELEDMVHTKGLEDIIRFHEPAYGAEKEQVLLEHDVFLIPSRFEGHPMALIEAMAYGLPCVATTGSNMQKEIDDANAGWTAENTTAALAHALTGMILNVSEFSVKSQGARNLAVNYQWANIALQSQEEFGKSIKPCQ